MKIELSNQTLDRFQYFYDRGVKKLQQRWLSEAIFDSEKYEISPVGLYKLWLNNDRKSSFDYPVCKVCGKKLNEFQMFRKSQTCSRECNGKDPDRMIKAKDTWINHFGVDHPSKCKQVRDRIVATNIERYGDRNPANNPVVKQKIKKTNKEKYGVEFPFQSGIVQDKAKQMILDIYGVTNVGQDQQVVQSRSKTQRNNGYQSYKQTLYDQHLIELESTKDQFINDDVLKFKCTQCGTSFEMVRDVASNIRCPICKGRCSIQEKQLENYIRSIYKGTIIHHDRDQLNGKEIDIYLPELKIGFEFDGNFWHSSYYKESDYHQKKSLQALLNGIWLIHIFEYQWINDQDKVKNHISKAITGDMKTTTKDNVDWNRYDVRELLSGHKIEVNQPTFQYVLNGDVISYNQYQQLDESATVNVYKLFDNGTINIV